MSGVLRVGQILRFAQDDKEGDRVLSEAKDDKEGDQVLSEAKDDKAAGGG